MIISSKTPKEKMLELGKHCSRSNHCCQFSSGYLAEGDLQQIAKFMQISEDELKSGYLEEVSLFNKKVLRPKRVKGGKPYGNCVFLTANGCSIHEVKPLHCRVYTCRPYGFDLTQWFYLNHVLDKDDPQALREYAQFLKFQEPIPGGSLEELVPDKDKLKRILNYERLER
ncbi:MAG: YkgJ family cysteine cluster protein [Candidatus Woesearchaeota archaeon]